MQSLTDAFPERPGSERDEMTPLTTVSGQVQTLDATIHIHWQICLHFEIHKET